MFLLRHPAQPNLHSMTPANRPPCLLDRTPRQILPPTSSQFHRLSSYLDLLQ